MKSAFTICLILLIAGTIYGEPARIGSASVDQPANKIIGSDDQIKPTNYVIPERRPIPRRDDLIGERFEAGDSWLDYQSNGSLGKLIAVDPGGGVHVTWMDGYDEEVRERHQKYNFFADEEWSEADGIQVDEGDRSGYGCLTLTEEDEPRAIVFAHASGEPFPDVYNSIVFVDAQPGSGAFTPTLLPGVDDQQIEWPQGVMSGDGIIHVVNNTSDVDALMYASGVLNDDDEIEWNQEVCVNAGEIHLNSYRIARSPNSERVAIIYMTSRVGIPAPDEWDGFLVYQMNNDLMLVWSDDGEEWNFDEPLNVTDCRPYDEEREGDDVYGDTLRPYTTMDLIFDAEPGEGSISVNPRFEDIEEGNYNLSSESRCIDAGDPDLPADPDGTRRDIGAFWRHRLSIEPESTVPNKIELTAYPNPFNSRTVIKFNVDPINQTLITVFDILGREIIHERIQSSEFIIAGEKLGGAGLYFLTIEAGVEGSGLKLLYIP